MLGSIVGVPECSLLGLEVDVKVGDRVGMVLGDKLEVKFGILGRSNPGCDILPLVGIQVGS